MTNVKWLARIELVDLPFTGYQQAYSYRLRQEDGEEGEALSRMRPRALMIPPGIPEFPARERTLPFAPCTLEGRAWSGRPPVKRVEVSDDGGETWNAAELGASDGPWAWRAWRYEWHPPAPGRYALSCRAHDASGDVQPVDAPWNVGGYANNAVQQVAVTVA
jgi:DMSO/TMAO reductase YedYZ molybdopterin-dependent catalytic subunit